MDAPWEKAIVWRKGRICCVFVFAAATCCRNESWLSMFIPRSLIVSELAIVLLPRASDVKVLWGILLVKR